MQYYDDVFAPPDQNIQADYTPGKILQHSGIPVALYAQRLEGDEKAVVDMRWPSLKASLYRLAENGLGYDTTYDGVSFSFKTGQCISLLVEKESSPSACPCVPGCVVLT